MSPRTSLDSQSGATFVEAAIALPLFIFIIAGSVAIGNLIEARSELLEQVAITARSLSVTTFDCTGFDAAVADFQTQFHDALSKQGYSGALEVTGLDGSNSSVSDPGAVSKWRVDGSISATCALCLPLQWTGVLPSSLSATTVIPAENPGCTPL